MNSSPRNVQNAFILTVWSSSTYKIPATSACKPLPTSKTRTGSFCSFQHANFNLMFSHYLDLHNKTQYLYKAWEVSLVPFEVLADKEDLTKSKLLGFLYYRTLNIPRTHFQEVFPNISKFSKNIILQIGKSPQSCSSPFKVNTSTLNWTQPPYNILSGVSTCLTLLETRQSSKNILYFEHVTSLYKSPSFQDSLTVKLVQISQTDQCKTFWCSMKKNVCVRQSF